MLSVIAAGITWFVRYRFLTKYSRLPPEPQRKEPQIDLFPDSQEGDSKAGLANYLDEFLSAIKIFGYLERPVFHELTRTMQTRKLIAGETLFLEEEKGFCMVVDGTVQIFVKSSREKNDSADVESDADDETEHPRRHRGYQLLTEVKNGASMSSLFSILSLFTEDVKLRHTDEKPHTPPSMSGVTTRMASPDRISASTQLSERDRPKSSGRDYLPKVPHLDLENGFDDDLPERRTRKDSVPRNSVHPSIVARAVVDTTIAVIPESAFRRLTRVYPKATAHIVQVILTRLQRVTFATAHSYLGLSSEVTSIEKSMKKFTAYDLPNHLRGTALDRLKSKFKQERERLTPEESAKGIALHNPSARLRKSSISLIKETLLSNEAAQMKHRSTSQSYQSGTGDLLSTINESRYGSARPAKSIGNSNPEPSATARSSMADSSRPFQRPDPFSRKELINEDLTFRDSIVDCMMKALGLTVSAHEPAKRHYSPADFSPQLLSADSRRHKTMFNNAFGFIDPYEALADESESVASLSAASATGASQLSGLKEDLKSEVEIVFFPKNSVLVEQGERNPGLYYVIDGFLDVGVSVETKKEDIIGTSASTSLGEWTTPASQKKTNNTTKKEGKKYRSLYLVKPGGIEGYLGSITSYRSFTNVTAKTDVYVGFLPRVHLERIADRHPAVLLTMAKRLTTVLPRLLLHIDFALEWVHVNAGQVIHHQRDDSDAIYIVLNGRLRSVFDKGNGKFSVIGEYGQGDSVGELEVMTESTRPGTLHAIRDTELARFPRTLFNSLVQEHPGITIQISRLIAQRMRNLLEKPLLDNPDLASPENAITSTATLNLRTVAIVPVTVGVPVVEFGSRLLHALNQVGVTNGVAALHQADIFNHLGRHAFSRMGKLKLSQYLADLEEKFGMLLYVADTSVNAPWTQTCITQADCILLVGVAEDSPSIGEYERFLVGMKTTARKELVLLHAERYSPPGLTRQWLKNRIWINGGHHHIQMPFRLPPEPATRESGKLGMVLRRRVKVLRAEIQKYTSRGLHQQPLYSPSTPMKGDFYRLARRLYGKAIGVVLGGGGARGIAHVGVLNAMEEAGIPIDIIGGTSIGSFIGGLYARDADVVPVYGRAKKFAGRMGSIWRFALDLTYPTSSYTTGHEFNRGIFKAFGNTQIEDFWLDFFCNTTNISKSQSEFHTSGYVWRYVRASMSLAGLVPPMCDDEGSMLLDGGYVDNLPVARMKSLGARVIFAVDVGSIDDNTPQAYGDSLSGAWTFFNRWNPFSSVPNPPTLSEIQARLAYVSSVDALERAKIMPGCVYMRPPIDLFGTLEFGRFDEIYRIGYEFGKAFLERLKNEGSLPVSGETEEKKLRRTMGPRRNSI